ncbi:MAG: cytochrome c oxidase accessory protein FixG [Myxococcota bacterium]|jgi:cytochrome c oxidase accessory protein FixG
MSLFSGTRKWVYYRQAQGSFQRLHRWSGQLLIAALFILPWVSLGGNPLLRIDLPARRLYMLGQIFTAGDGFLIALAALTAAFSLFVISALFGRLWCGWLCPQTVFLEEWVRLVETAIEGEGLKRQRRDAGPWNVDKVWRKTAKVAVLQVLSLALGLTVMSYFAGASKIWTLQAGPVDYAMVGILSTGAMVDWLWFREQLCIYLCPYARFQSALTDSDSLMVAFDNTKPIGKGKAFAANGDCFDCGKCVNVCPMGIDIRDGFQLECINCARCVDACTRVMEPLGHETIVRYSTLTKEEGGKTRWLRPRTLLYGAIITGLGIALISGVFLHNPIEVSLNRMVGSTYVIEDDGRVRNTYMLRIVNNDPNASHAFAIGVVGLNNVQVSVAPVILEAGEDRTIPLMLRVPATQRAGSQPFEVIVRNAEATRTVNATFIAPYGGQG